MTSLSSFGEDKVTLLVTLTPAGSFSAVSQKPKGNLVKSKGVFTSEKITISIESFKTGIDLRDEHFWKHLQSNKYPKATLHNLTATQGRGKATLEVNGIKKPIVIAYEEKETEILAKFKVNASDFSLPKVEYLGVGVDNTVSIEANMSFKSI